MLFFNLNRNTKIESKINVTEIIIYKYKFVRI